MLARRSSKFLARSLAKRRQQNYANVTKLLLIPQPDFSRRNFSDKLMGYSPMAPEISQTSTKSTGEQRIPTAKDVSLTGGVWAPTSAKRDKLGELKTALEEGQKSLDDAATPQQLQDLYLADGFQLIAKVTDSLPDMDTKEILDFSEWLVAQQQKMPEDVDKDKLEAHLEIVSQKVSSIMATIPTSCLNDVRDFLDPATVDETDVLQDKMENPDLASQDDAFAKCVLLFRLQLTQAAIEHLKESWDAYTTVSDGDVDRAAVKGVSLEPQASTMPLSKVYAYLFAHMSGTCSDRVDASWQLVDRDNDGLLEQSEMNVVAQMCLAPVQKALVKLFEHAMEEGVLDSGNNNINEKSPAPKKGWRQRRKEAKARKLLMKLFHNATKRHFEDEVELNHRLRCIYAWAEKAHQDNKLDSVMVDSGWSGKKRYVELKPKISLPEFREVQQEHFTHIDRIGTEILKSFREDLWVIQGKGRERKELIRDSFLFLTIVNIADYLILAS
eukprot:scaffold1019_cov123-Cylindrotheca_fusiformis.AAC.2